MLLVIFPFAFLSYLIVEKPWMKLGDHWRGIIQTKHREKLKLQEDRTSPQQTSTEQGTASALSKEVITK
jgi:peptidoglycan/LPS O-acetylase OafA/YrhL